MLFPQFQAGAPKGDGNMEDEKKTNPAGNGGEDQDGDGTGGNIGEEDVKEGGKASEGGAAVSEAGPTSGAVGAGKPKQSRKEDSYYAALNRGKGNPTASSEEERIRREAEFDVKKGLVKQDTLKELGLEAVESQDDLFLTEKYDEACKNGEENPSADAYKALRAKELEAKKAEEGIAKKDGEERAAIAKDQTDFKSKYGKTTAEALSENDGEFRNLFGNFLKPGNFTQLYGAYLKSKGNVKDEAKDKGSFPTGSSGQTADKKYEEMTPEEKKKYFDKKYR
jgi:hypothetical protein